MSNKLLVRIILPSETFLEVETSQVNIPGAEGVFGVLPGHVKLTSAIEIGIASIFNNEVETRYYIHGGVVQITGDEVNIVTEYAASIPESNKTTITNEITDLQEELSSEEEGSIEADIILDKIEKHKSLIKFL
ncbi:MAG: ATP synthase F1 subunit epsilon [Pseudomonadota bacterium]